MKKSSMFYILFCMFFLAAGLVGMLNEPVFQDMFYTVSLVWFIAYLDKRKNE